MALKHFKSRPTITLSLIVHSALGVFTALGLCVTLLITNLAQMTSLILLPFSRTLFRDFNRRCAGSWWGSCVQVLKTLHGMHLIITGDEIPRQENALLIVNHQGMVDVFPLMMLAQEKGTLKDLKWFVKDILKYIPGMGWGMLFLDCIFVKRSWNQDQAQIEKTFSNFKKNHIPLWLISFVEGTRITPEKLKKNQAYCKEKGLPILSHCMIPKTKGFVASVNGLSSCITAVYDVTLIYRSGVPSIVQLSLGYIKEFELHIRRYPLDTLPQDASALSQWLKDRYVEKNLLLSRL